MTQIFTKEGKVVPCTIIDVSDVRIVGKRTKNKDGYDAIILGIGKKKKPNKCEIVKYKELKYVPNKSFEFRDKIIKEEVKINVGEEIKADIFKEGDKVNVTGVVKGRGFQGVVKRWNFKGGPRTHGQSDRERTGGSIGAGTTPGRVLKGKKMPGRMGGNKKTILNLEIVKVDQENSILCIKGAVPGARNSLVRIFKY